MNSSEHQKMKPYVSIQYSGGLGNQLFGLFTAANIAITHDISLHIIDNHESPSVTPRKTYWKDTRLFTHNHLYTSGILITELPNNHLTTLYIDEPENYVFFDKLDEIVANAIKSQHNIILRKGYWQSQRYFAHNISRIINFLGMKDIITNYKLRLIPPQPDRDCRGRKIIRVAIHIRQGDYMCLAHIFNVLN
jgi:hypothetical protein